MVDSTAAAHRAPHGRPRVAVSSREMAQAFWSGPVETISAGDHTGLVGIAHGCILCSTVIGRLLPPVADRLRALGEDAIAAHGRLWIFCDWSEMTGYDSRCRTELTDWASGHGDIVQSVHVLTGATLVRMGVTVASIFIKRVVSHDDATSFRAAYREAARLTAAR
jgi:hypothetical protein